MDYDIQQQELVSVQPTHDISTLDLIALTLIATQLHGGIPLSSIPLSKPGSSPLKCPSAHSDNQMGPSLKCVCLCCFRCGGSSHLPQDCIAESTSAGCTPTSIATNAKSKHVLLVPNRKQYCFNFAQKSSCTFRINCINFHSCSLCNNATHGDEPSHSVLMYTPLFLPLYHFPSVADTPATRCTCTTAHMTPVSLRDHSLTPLTLVNPINLSHHQTGFVYGVYR